MIKLEKLSEIHMGNGETAVVFRNDGTLCFIAQDYEDSASFPIESPVMKMALTAVLFSETSRGIIAKGLLIEEIDSQCGEEPPVN